MQHTKALAAKVSRLVKAGIDSHLAARSLGMTSDELDDWLAEDAEFAALLKRSEAQAEIDLIKQMWPADKMRAINKRKRAAHFARLRELST